MARGHHSLKGRQLWSRRDQNDSVNGGDRLAGPNEGAAPQSTRMGSSLLDDSMSDASFLTQRSSPRDAFGYVWGHWCCLSQLREEGSVLLVSSG